MSEDLQETQEDVEWLRARVSELEERVADLAVLTETVPIIYRCLRTVELTQGWVEDSTPGRWTRDINRLDELAHLLVG
jgi:hypothetical protein